MEFLLRNAIVLRPKPQNQTCAANMSSITFKSIDEGVTTLELLNGQLASQSAGSAQPTYLTSSAVVVSTGPTFSCIPGNGLAPNYITISFALSKAAADYVTATPVIQTF